MPHVDEEEIRVGAIDSADQQRTRTNFLRSAASRTNLLPILLVLTAMMVALWLMGMPFLQALTISTALKITMVLFAARQLPCASKG
ncbi:hypothetical protein [Streptomyces sp. NPDC093970]|uniref:hypothetical protein n=1 Tax=Streptomyces sp. NPDC093970 TaxID=3155076 RepID=UPI0034196D28